MNPIAPSACRAPQNLPLFLGERIDSYSKLYSSNVLIRTTKSTEFKRFLVLELTKMQRLWMRCHAPLLVRPVSPVQILAALGLVALHLFA